MSAGMVGIKTGLVEWIVGAINITTTRKMRWRAEVSGREDNGNVDDYVDDGDNSNDGVKMQYAAVAADDDDDADSL